MLSRSRVELDVVQTRIQDDNVGPKGGILQSHGNRTSQATRISAVIPASFIQLF
jgi:hypothetical protein